MFTFFRKNKPALPDLSGLVTDMHSHLLPGIDDGSPDAATSVELIRGMMELGYKNFITTPHIMWDVYQNTPATIRAAHSVLQDALQQAALDVRLHAAAEYFIDDHFDSMLDEDVPLLTLKENWVLVEISFVNVPFDVKDILFKMQIKGYQPVLAHPERYVYLKDNLAFYDKLRDAGCLFQLNLLSLTSYYGKAPTDLANYLIGRNYIDLLGTDLHHQRHLDSLQHAGSAMDTVQRLLDSGRLLNAVI